MKFDVFHFLLVAFAVVFFVFLTAPLIVVVVISFSNASFIAFPITAWSTRWYLRIVDYRPFIDSLITSLELAFASAACASLVAIPAAMGLARARGTMATAIVALLLSPLSIPMVVLGFSLLYYLASLGFGTAFLPLLIAHTVVSIPYIARTVIAVYRGLSPDLEEAAAILGANAWHSFRLITLPLIRPGLFAGAMFSILISLDNLPLSFFFGNATTTTLPVVMLSYMQNQFDPAVAAISTVQMGLAVVLLLIVERVYGLQSLNAA